MLTSCLHKQVVCELTVAELDLSWVSVQIGQRQYDLRFWNAGEHGFDIEAVLLVTVVPAAPSLWQIWPIEGEDSCIEVQEQDQGWTVMCGKQFTVALELVDEFGNKYDLDNLQAALVTQNFSLCHFFMPGSCMLETKPCCNLLVFELH